MIGTFKWCFNKLSPTITRHWVEVALLGAVLLAALVFRLWRLDTVPAGLHFDEAIDLQQSLLVAGGARPIYISEGWGREALYYYWVAAVLQLVTNNMLALRLTAVLCSLGAILATYFFARFSLNRPTALLAAALLSLNFWSLFTARFGVRHMSLPFMLGLTILAFWWAWQMAGTARPKAAAYALAGLLLGLTLYTYQPARFAPFIFLFFILYLLPGQRPVWQQNRAGFVLMAVTAVLITIPLILALQRADIELATRDWLVQPLLKLLAGDPRPAMQNGLATLKMFSFAGDPLVAYNVPGRPVFVPTWISLFLYAGVTVALRRWRQPVYPFLLIWLIVMLAPTVLTTSAPNYNRAIAAQAPTMLLTAVGMVETVRWLVRRAGPQAAAAPLVLFILAFYLLGRLTWHDYFHVWPQQELIAIQYNVSPSTAARILEEQADGRAVLMNTRGIEDADPIIFDSILDRTDLEIRWVDTGMALVMPAGQSETRILLGANRWIDGALSHFANLQPQPYFANEYVALYETRAADWRAMASTAVYTLPASAAGPTTAVLEQPSTAPTFAESVQLRAVYLPTAVMKPGDTLTFLTDWNILQDGEAVSLAFFVHLLDQNDKLVAQQDGLGFPPHSWRRGDRMLHVHYLPTTIDLPPGTYGVQFGLYRRETGERWLLDNSLHDRLVIGPIEVGP